MLNGGKDIAPHTLLQTDYYYVYDNHADTAFSLGGHISLN